MAKANNKATLSWIKSTVPSKTAWAVALLSVFGIIISILSTYSAVLIKGVIDSAVSSDGGLWTRLAVYGAYIVALLLMEIAHSLLSARTTAKTDIKLRSTVMGAVTSKDYRTVSAYHSGDVLSRATMDVSVVSNAITQVVPGILSVIARVISAFVILIFTDATLGLIVLATAPITLVASHFYGKKIKVLHHKAQQVEGKNRSFMTEIVQNMTVIRAFRSQKPVFDYFDGLQGQNFDTKMKINRFSVLANVLMFVSVSLVYFFTIAWGANKIIVEGVVAFGALTATLQLVTQFQAPMRSLAGLTNQYYRGIASAERIKEIDEIPAQKGAENTESCQDFDSLKFDGVSFAYEDGVDVISNLTFEAKRGEVVVLSGKSGAGKSTALKLAMGLLVPSKGSIYLTGTNNCDNKSIFSYVPQGNMILSGTIRDNVSFFNPAVGDDEINAAIKACCLDDVVAALPNGINSVIGERGAGLSEGQVQRLSIARAIVMNKKILLLDEATSALDDDTEKKVLDNLAACNYTVLLVTHNKNVKDRFDKVINID